MPNATADQSQTVRRDGDLTDFAPDIVTALASVQGEIQDAVNWVDNAFGTAKPGRPRLQLAAFLKSVLRRDQDQDEVSFELSAERA